MFRDDSLAGNWQNLVARLNGTGRMARWVALEPALAEARDVEGLARCLAAGGDPDRADRLLGALVRLAAADGGDDADAVLLLLHLLSDGCVVLASRMRDLSDDILPLIVGQLAMEIRAFPWRRRTRAYAANLLLDTKGAVWRELRPRRRRPDRVPAGQGDDILVDPLDQQCVSFLLDSPVPHPADTDEVDLADVVMWATRRNIAPAADLDLLLDLARRERASTQNGLARTHAINERTLRRRRDRALAALQAARQEYLLAVA